MARRKVESKRVTVELRGRALSQVEEILGNGLHGHKIEDVVQRLVEENLLTRSKGGRYVVFAKLEGFPAYVIEKYTRMTRGNINEVLEFVVNHWIVDHPATLSSGGIGLNDPEWQDYLEKYRKR